MTQSAEAGDWSTRLALSIAHEVRRHRQMQGLSAQQLSDRCAEIGMPIQRSVLANLESGRRTTVTVAEVLVLAEALNVAPAGLIFPAGYSQEVEALPSAMVSPLQAADWFSGRAKLSGYPTGDTHSPLSALRHHQLLVERLSGALADRERLRAEAQSAQMRATEKDRFRKSMERVVVDFVRRFATESPERAAELSREMADQGARERIAEVEAAQASQAAQFVKHQVDSIESTITNLVVRVSKLQYKMEERGWLFPPLREDIQEVVRQRAGLQDQGDIYTPFDVLNEED